jgi:hypothetical protein
MQRIRVEKVQPIGKDGTAIFDEEGTRFSGFQPGLKYVRAGDSIGIDIEVKGKYNNITAFKILEYGQWTTIVPGGENHSVADRESPSSELRASIETQTAFKGIVELACHLPVEGKLGVAYEKALDWAITRLGGRFEFKSIISITKQTEKSTNNGIDTDWLKRALKTLQDSGTQGWSNAAVVASLNRITGNNARSVSEAIKPLNRKQANQFIGEVRAALEKG